MSTEGFVSTIEGCPISFGTAGLVNGAVTSSDANWPANVTLVPDMLVPPKLTWSETQHPLDGTIEVGGITLQLRDQVSKGETTAVPVGEHSISWLTTRTGIGSTSLSSAMAPGDFVAHTNDSSQLPAAPCVIWIDQEAMTVVSYTGNQANIGVRGYYGTAVVAHTFNSDFGDRPVVFAEFPGFDRQRCILWRVANNVATAMWVGYLQHAPALMPGKNFAYKAQAEHFTKTDAMLPAGPPAATCRLRGVNLAGVGVGIGTNGMAGQFQYDSPGSPGYGFTTIAPSMSDAVGIAMGNLNISAPLAGTLTRRWAIAVDDASVSANVTTTGAATLTLKLQIGPTEVSQTTTDVADPRTTTVVAQGCPPVVIATMDYTATPIPVDRVDGLPSSWSATPTTEADGSQTIVTPMLMGEVSDEDYVQVLPSGSSSSDPNLSSNGASVTGLMQFRARKPYSLPARYKTYVRGYTVNVLTKPVLLRLTARVVSNHWLYALRRGCVEDTTSVHANLDPRQYDWTDSDRVVSLTSDTVSHREWYLDGTRTWGDLLSNSLKLGGCAPGIRNGRMTIVPMQAPMPTDPVVATINGSGANSNLVEGATPEWGTFEDGVANAVHFKSDYVDLIVQDGLSVAKYRQARMREIDLTQSIGSGLVSAVDTPQGISQTVMRRYIGTWGKPHRFVKLKLGPSWNGRLAHGDLVQLNNLYNVPDGNGRYGLSGIGQVFSREVSTKDDANVQYGFILYNVGKVAAISPCVRIGAIAGATVTVVIGYLSAVVTDYAGSNLSGYALPALDGGIGRFFVGDKVQMLERDTATPLLESLTIQSINYGTGAITFTTTPSGSWAAKIATGMVDLRFDHYSVSSPQADQKPWAWVGAESPSVIDATSDRNQKFSP